MKKIVSEQTLDRFAVRTVLVAASSVLAVSAVAVLVAVVWGLKNLYDVMGEQGFLVVGGVAFLVAVVYSVIRVVRRKLWDLMKDEF